MSNSCARAVVLGIAALYEIAEEAGNGPIKPSLALRALLALVYEASHAARKRDRRPFDAFWKAVTNAGRDDLDEIDRNYARQHAATSQVSAIARTFGMRPESEEYRAVIAGLRRNQRMALDPELRARIYVTDRLAKIKHIPRNVTLEEWENHLRQGWTERPRR